MNFQLPHSLAAAGILALALGGCGKQDSPVTPPAAPPAPAAQGTKESGAIRAAERVLDTAEGQTEVLKEKAMQVTQQVTTQAQAQVEAITSKGQDLLNNAQKLIAESKWAEALGVLNELGQQSLTPQQQSAVQALKEQAQLGAQSAAKTKATDEALKAVGSRLPGQR